MTDSPHQHLVTLGNLTGVDIRFLQTLVTTVVFTGYAKLVKLVHEHDVRLVQLCIGVSLLDAHAHSGHHFKVRHHIPLVHRCVLGAVVVEFLACDVEERLDEAQLDLLSRLLVCPVDNLVSGPHIRSG